ncbi:MAG: alanine--tRNA ligase-related protein, partial [Nanoarchaeota archaeon]|nr:alanine--tRNA ligase-related protein [Nanoarchaeota archaeon]
ESHPEGKKLVNSQKCLRTDDIDEVGDLCHHTFFEMLGNWSLGDYWKKEAITLTFEFLTKELGIDPEKLSVTCFAGDKDAPKDTESEEVWKSLGIPQKKISFKGKKDNWWASPGDTGPCGPDSEIFIDQIELGNNVFMEYQKTADGKFEKLEQRNVDFGGGLERILAVVNGFDDDYQTDLFAPIISAIENILGKKYKENKVAFRIIADHLRATTFIIADGVEPSNKERGYILRRLIRRATLQLKKMGAVDLEKAGVEIAEVIIQIMSPIYPELEKNSALMIQTCLPARQVIETEIKKFNQTLEK